MNVFYIVFCCFFGIQFVYSQIYFTEKQKNAIINKHRQRLANEAMKMFENQFRKSSSHQTEMFDQIFNYKGLYENLDIRNISSTVIENCHENIQPLIGFDYKRHRNHNYLVCFSTNSFLVQTFRVDNIKRHIIFDNLMGFDTKNIQGSLMSAKFYRRYDTDQLFIAALLSKGVQQIRIFEIVDGPRIIDKELLHTFKIHERVSGLDIIHFDNNRHRIVSLIDSGWIHLDRFVVETDQNIIRVFMQQALRLRTLRIHSQGFLVVANTTHWAVYRYQDRNVELINIFMMKYFIKDLQVFNNGHRYYVGVATHNEQYIYQWKDGKRGFQGVARMRMQMVYKMNSITISYSREDNFFYFDQINSDSISIYGYDITNSIFILLKTFSKSQLNISSNIVFNPLYSNSFYDHNFVYELKLSKSQLYLFVYETAISLDRSSKVSLNNLQRYNKQIYEDKIDYMTKNIFKLVQQETISKAAINLTFNFNVTFRGNVNVNRYITIEDDIPNKIHINRRDYTFDEIHVSLNKIQQQIDEISFKMEQLNKKLRDEVVYRNQNTKISGYKNFVNKIFVKKVYAKQASVKMYRGRNVDDILANLYRNGQNVPIIGRKTFLSNLNVEKFLLVNKINEMNPEDFLYVDLEQDVYSNFWYGNQLQTDQMIIKDDISSNISLSAAVFINQNTNQLIHIKNKMVFDSLNVDNLYVDTIDEVSITELPKQVLNRRASHNQVIKVPTQIERLFTHNNILVNYINNHNITEVFGNIIFRNRNVQFESPVQFLADVTMNLVNIKGKINDIKIPEDLLDRHSKQIVYGVKRFSSVHVENINVTNLNHLRIPTDIVTLSQDEVIKRDLSIDRLLVNGNLQVDGLFDGINLTHLDRRFIDSFRDNYHNLTFLKPVNVSRLTIKGDINGKNLDKLYSNAYFKNERTLFIPSKKVINNVLRCGNILAETINGEMMENYWSLHESISFSQKVTFVNNVYFEKVNLNGTIDNVNVNQLFNEIVTLNTFQVLTGNKEFSDGIKVLNHLKIDGKINEISPENWMLYSKIQDIRSPMRFINVKCRMLSIEGNLQAKTVNEKNFTKIASNLIYLDQSNTFNALFHCINCSASNIITSTVNLKNFSHFLNNYLSKSKPQVINSAKMFLIKQEFNDIYTKNGVVGGIELKNLKYQAVTVDGYNIITNPVVIYGDLILTAGQITTLKWNHINIENFNHQIVHRKYQEQVRIHGDIVYSADVDLMADVYVKKLNKYAPEEVLMTTYGNYTLYNDVHFNQKLISLNDIQVRGHINSVNLTTLERDVLKTNERGELIITNDEIINFINPCQTNEIIVKGLVDNVTLNQDSIVMINNEQNIKKLVLDGSQWFNGSINVMSQINQYNKDNLVKIVLVDSSEEQQIEFQKTFTKVKAREIHHSNGLINVNMINSINLADFNSNVLYPKVDRVVTTNKRFLDNVTINGPNFKVIGLVNGINLIDVVRLDRVKQTITGKKIFDSVTFDEDIDVDGFLNTLDIPKISKDMLLVYGHQHIRTPITFIAPVFMMSKNTIKWFNQYHPEDLITIHGDRIINGHLNFNNILVPKINVQKHLVNGLNLTDIDQYGFMNESPNPNEVQDFNGSLIINEAEFIKNVSLETHLNDLDLSETVQSIEGKFNPEIDAHEISQELFKYKAMISYYKFNFEYKNLEIDYFYRSNLTELYSNLELIHFQQRFKVINVSDFGFNAFDILYKRKNILWQTVKIEEQLYIIEMWQQNINEEVFFNLVNLDQTTGRSWIIILEKNLPPGSRPFIFSMDQFLYIIYYNSLYKDDNDCWRHSNIETKLFLLNMDFSQLNYNHQWIQNFAHENIGNVGHYRDQSNFHYIVFSVNSELFESQIIIYQRYNANCRFRLFQTISIFEPIRQISLFTLGISTFNLEPYMIFKTDHHLYIWKQEGINGFTRKWSINTPGNKYSINNQNNLLLFPFINSNTRFIIYVSEICVDGQKSFYEAHFNQDFMEGTVINLILNDYV